MLNGFSDEQIVSMLGSHTLWGRRACREILRRKEDFIPGLIRILDAVAADPAWDNPDDENYELLIPAAFLLAQMREGRAYPRLVELISYDDDTVDSIWGDILCEQYIWILRDTFNGDAALLPRLIEDRTCGEFSRAMALKAWGMLYFDGHISREEIIRYFRHLIHNVYAGRPDKADVIVLSFIADVAREQRLEALFDDVKTIYKRNGIDRMLCGDYKTYSTDFRLPIYAAEDRHIDAIRELDKWNWFEEKNDEEDK
jgi:hypothetical protein